MSTFTKKRLGRVAASTLVAVLAGIVLMSTCDNPVRAITGWAIFVVVAAIVLNTKNGESARVLSRLAILPAITPLLVWSYPALFHDKELCISAVRLTGKHAGFILGFCTFVAVASWLAITLFAFARTFIIDVATATTRPALVERIKIVDALIRSLISLAGTVGLLYLAISGKSS